MVRVRNKKVPRKFVHSFYSGVEKTKVQTIFFMFFVPERNHRVEQRAQTQRTMKNIRKAVSKNEKLKFFLLFQGFFIRKNLQVFFICCLCDAENFFFILSGIFSPKKQKNPIKFFKLFSQRDEKVCTSISCLINLESVWRKVEEV